MKDDAIVRWSARRPLCAVAAFLGVAFVLLVLALLDKANDTPQAFGLFALVLIAGLTVGLVVVAVRSEVVLNSTGLRSRGRRGNEILLPLDQVRGVAVVRAQPGWAIFIWPASGPPLRLAAPDRVFWLKAQSRASADETYWRQVAVSPAGTAAQLIYRQARTVQGSTGALSRPGVAVRVAGTGGCSAELTFAGGHLTASTGPWGGLASE